MLKLNRLPRTSSIDCENGIFVPLEPIDHFNEAEYLALAKETIEHYQTHANQVPHETSSRLTLFHTPATAVIVGTGTVGLEAIVYASRILPLHSTILIFQNDVKDIEKLKRILQTTIKGVENFKLIISPSMDIGRIDQIENFLEDNRNDLSHTQLFIHTADKAKRYIPDNVNYREVVAQIIRRSSIPVIEEFIEHCANARNPYVRILFSSVCSINRDTYRLPNIGPYQIGKIVGDEFFKAARVRKHAYSFILYSGGMHTMGETLTRNEEFRLLKKTDDSFREVSEQEYTEQWSQAGTHVDSMDSSGLMFKEIWNALHKGDLISGRLYSIYGTSVPTILGYELNTLKVVEAAPYMFDLLERTT